MEKSFYPYLSQGREASMMAAEVTEVEDDPQENWTKADFLLNSKL